MNLDYIVLKEYLNFFRNSNKPILTLGDLFNLKGFDNYNEISDHIQNEAYHYLHLMKDEGLIECISDNVDIQLNLGFTPTSNFTEWLINVSTAYRLTSLGYKVVEAMSNNMIWNKIKTSIKTIGIEGVKQIPSLALALFKIQ